MAVPRRAEIALAAFSSLMVLAVLEGGVRLSGAGRPRPTGYAPVKTDLRFGRPRNARGYRDAEHAPQKAPNGRRLLVLGDSFAWGAGIEFDDTWGQRLARRLSQRRHEPWEVVNLALPGLAANDYAAQLAAEGMPFSPDLVIVGWVLNDAESKQQMRERERSYAERERRPPSLLDASALLRLARERLAALADRRERVRYHAQLYDDGSPGWSDAQRALKSIGALCREYGVPWAVAIFPMFANPLDASYPFSAVHAKVEAAAELGGARVIDLLPAYAGLDWRLLVVNGPADEHPNEIAHRIAADWILHALDAVIPPPPPAIAASAASTEPRVRPAPAPGRPRP